MNKIIKITYFFFFFFFFSGICVIESHRLHERADRYYYGVWETKKGASVKIKVEIDRKRQTKVYINNIEIENKSYYFIDGPVGRGTPHFVWSNEDESIAYRLYFISGGNYKTQYAVGFYNVTHADLEGVVTKEDWYEIKLYKIPQSDN